MKIEEELSAGTSKWWNQLTREAECNQLPV